MLPAGIISDIESAASENYGRIELSYKLYDVLEKRGGQKIDINELHKIDTKKITTKKGDVSYVSSIKKNEQLHIMDFVKYFKKEFPKISNPKAPMVLKEYRDWNEKNFPLSWSRAIPYMFEPSAPPEP